MVDVSLDNVTFVGRWRDWSHVCECVQDWARDDGSAERCRFLGSRGYPSGDGAFQQCAVVDGAHVSNWSRESEYFLDVRKDARNHPARLELNPNRMSPRVLYLLRQLDVDHASRVDVALDYYGVPVGAYTWRRDRVKSCEWVGPGGVESLVLGSRSSDRFVRVYDKGLELGREGLVMTRVEGMGRKHYALSDDLFDGVEGFSRVISDDLSVDEAGRLLLFLMYPEYLRGCDKRTLRKVKEMARERQAQVSPAPSEVYRDARARCVEMVDALAAGERVPVAAVYQD